MHDLIEARSRISQVLSMRVTSYKAQTGIVQDVGTTSPSQLDGIKVRLLACCCRLEAEASHAGSGAT